MVVINANSGQVLTEDLSISSFQTSLPTNTFLLHSTVHEDKHFFYDPLKVRLNKDVIGNNEDCSVMTLNITKPFKVFQEDELDNKTNTKERVQTKVNYLNLSIPTLDELYSQVKVFNTQLENRLEAKEILLNHLLNVKLTELNEKGNRNELEELGYEIREFQKKFRNSQQVIEMLRLTKTQKTTNSNELNLLQFTQEDENKIAEKYEVVMECLKIDKFIVKAMENTESKIKTLEKSEEEQNLFDFHENWSEYWEKFENWNEVKKKIQFEISQVERYTSELQLTNFELTCQELITKLTKQYNKMMNSFNEMKQIYEKCHVLLQSYLTSLYTCYTTLDTCLHSIQTYREGGNLLRRLQFLSNLPKVYQITMHEVVRRKKEFKQQKLEIDTINMIENLFVINCQLENEKRELFDEEIKKSATQTKDLEELKKLVPGLIGERVNHKNLITRLSQFITSLLKSVDNELPKIEQLEDVDFYFITNQMSNDYQTPLGSEVESSIYRQMNNTMNTTTNEFNDMSQSVFLRHVSDQLPQVSNKIDKKLEKITKLNDNTKNNLLSVDNNKEGSSIEKNDNNGVVGNNVSPIQQKHQQLSELYTNLMNAANSIMVSKNVSRETELEAEIVKLRSEIDNLRNIIESFKYQMKEESLSYQKELSLKSATISRYEKEINSLKNKNVELENEIIQKKKENESTKKEMSNVFDKLNNYTNVQLELEEMKKEVTQLRSKQQQTIGNANTVALELQQQANQQQLLLKQKISTLENEIKNKELTYQRNQNEWTRKMKELQEKFNSEFDNSQMQMKIIRTLQDTVKEEREKMKVLEKTNNELKEEVNQLRKLSVNHKKLPTLKNINNNNYNQNKVMCALSNIELGDRLIFFKVVLTGNKVLWQAFTKDGKKYYLSPETLEALQSYYKNHYQLQSQVFGIVVEMTSGAEQQNPYHLDHEHYLVTAIID
ncbi:hypothetical protein ABK040_014024 [Willaertia magna]